METFENFCSGHPLLFFFFFFFSLDVTRPSTDLWKVPSSYKHAILMGLEMVALLMYELGQVDKIDLVCSIFDD